VTAVSLVAVMAWRARREVVHSTAYCPNLPQY